MRRISGFTLIELSIVLVIVALIVGGLVAGSILIDQAKLRQAGAQVESYKTAVFTFRSKYSSLPGDTTKASDFGLGANGNGNDTVEAGEIALFWKHLSAAGLIPDAMSGVSTPSVGIYGNPVPYTIGLDVPRSKYKDSLGIYPIIANTANEITWSMIGHVFSLSNSILGYYGYGMPSRSRAFPFDAKFDDGKPGMGSIQSISNFSSGPANGYCATTTDPVTAQYPADDVSSTPARCPLYIRAGF